MQRDCHQARPTHADGPLRTIRQPVVPWLCVVLLGLLLPVLGAGCSGPGDAGTAATASSESPADATSGEGLRIGLLFDTTGPLGDFGRTGEEGARLAALHVESAGGVRGGAITLRAADGQTNVDVTVREARRLVEVENVDALIGPLGSAAAEAVVVRVSAPTKMLTLSPTATAPGLSSIEDDGYFFRATASDAAQAPVLADLAASTGARHAAIFFQDDTYGRGLSDAFARTFKGRSTLVPVGSADTDVSAALDRAVADGADLLVAMTYVPAAIRYLDEALRRDLFDHIALVDATASVDLVEALGADRLEGIGGTAPAGSVPGLDAGRSEGAAAFDAAFRDHYGRDPVSGLEASAYDLVIALALAAERAAHETGDTLRSALPQVTGGGGRVFGPGADAVAAALKAVRDGSVIDYDGASSNLEWDARGDLATGSISLWVFRDGGIVETESVAFDNRLQASNGALNP